VTRILNCWFWARSPKNIAANTGLDFARYMRWQNISCNMILQVNYCIADIITGYHYGVIVVIISNFLNVNTDGHNIQDHLFILVIICINVTILVLFVNNMFKSIHSKCENLCLSNAKLV
jgi:hypothetical protein